MVTEEAKNHQFGNEHAAELIKQLFIYLGITCNPQHVKANQLECNMNLHFQSKTMQYELVFSIKDYVNKT